MDDSATLGPGRFGDVEDALARVAQAPPSRRASVARAAPIARVQVAALTHPDPFVRRRCLDFLDHHASDDSASVFARALADPVEVVRHTALHSIACERCGDGELCLADVVPRLVVVLATDPAVEMRHKAIPVLLRLADRDGRARAAVERAAAEDEDELVRDVARRALQGEHVRARKAYVRTQRRR